MLRGTLGMDEMGLWGIDARSDHRNGTCKTDKWDGKADGPDDWTEGPWPQTHALPRTRQSGIREDTGKAKEASGPRRH